MQIFVRVTGVVWRRVPPGRVCSLRRHRAGHGVVMLHDAEPIPRRKELCLHRLEPPSNDRDRVCHLGRVVRRRNLPSALLESCAADRRAGLELKR